MLINEDYLVEHARKLVWCSPYENDQYILRLSRLTRVNGALNEANIFSRNLGMPGTRWHYHVFMIGGNFPDQFRLPEEEEVWIPITQWCNTSKMLIKVYDDHGILIPLRHLYYYREDDGNLLLAIEDDGTLPFEPGFTEVYCHLYMGDYSETFADTKYDAKSIRVTREGIPQEMVTDYAKRTSVPYSDLDHIKELGYYTVAFKNGQPCHRMYESKDNDNIDYITGDFGLYAQYYRVSDLPVFQSTLDKCNKYLLMTDSANKQLDNHVFYRDDVEVYLMKIKGHNWDSAYLNDKNRTHLLRVALDKLPVITGCYYHRNHEDSLRMVTNIDMSVPVDYVHGFIRHLDEQMDLDNWFIKVIVKNDTLNRKLIPERHRLYALNSLSLRDKRNAMVNTESNVDAWKAAELEHSSYNYIMRCYRHELTSDRVLDAYGYMQSALALANPNVSITEDPNGNYFIMPIGLTEKATVFEYDEEGYLIDYKYHLDGAKYKADERTHFLEAFSGLGVENPAIYKVDNGQMIDRDPNINYRFYMADINPKGEITSAFRDVTLADSIISESEYPDGRPAFAFKFNDKTNRLMVIQDDRWTLNRLTLNDSDGVYDFTLTYMEEDISVPMLIPPAKIAVWCNGKALIEGVDYIVDFPTVTLISKQPMAVEDGGTIDVVYRCIGFCNPDMTRWQPKEVGFIWDSKLSNDARFDLHYNEISRIIVNGRVLNPHGIDWDEEGEATISPNGRHDGYPYMIDDHYVPLKGLAGNKIIYQYQVEDRDMRSKMEDYITPRKYLEVPDLTVVRRMYEQYSPFMSAIIHEVLLNQEKYLDVNYRDNVALEKVVKKFKHLLKRDPAYLGHDVDWTIIHPLPYIYTEEKIIHHRLFGLFENIAKRYLNAEVDLNKWFRVTRTRTPQ